MKKLKRLIYLKLARRLNRSSNGPVPSIISRSTKIKGNIVSDSIVHVDGVVDGDISCEELIIGNSGSVNGTVNASSMQLFGSLTGTALVDNIFIAKSAKMVGDTSHHTIAIEPGAFIDGRCIRKDYPHMSEGSQTPELKVIKGSAKKAANQ